MDFQGNEFIFIVTNAIGGLGTYAIMLSLFRLNFRKHLWSVTRANVIISIVTLFLYKGFGFAALEPLAWLLLTLFFLVKRMSIRLTWALFIAILGYVVYQLLAGAIVFGWPGGYFNVQQLHAHFWKNYIVDAMSGLLSIWLATLLIRRQWSFNFEFAKVRPWESVLVFAGALCLLGTMAWIIVMWEVHWIAICGWGVFILGLGVHLAFATREELRQNSLMQSGMWWLKKDKPVERGKS
ncbi:hypothetical protein GZH47_21045 [Paenibacillus rhizovicinus]|uniref:Uncharacterized protein n=1 Tax=Paenibacillus rhizovicinus TaxID=2704463 RepID=A0A6C0P3H9_9BACL|nr:hypothetical protein [Paenibacillus rhizovicinus]QHW33039.1 hypothetical protein GZH47_21045 [Paenibacillus rhizovicinus]